MSVKGVSANQHLYEIRSKQEKQSQQSAPDKDPNGQSPQQESKHHKFTEEDIKKAVDKMKQIKGIKENNLQVSFQKKGYVYVVYVTDVTGKVVRRIPEQDLVHYLDQDEIKPSGHILNKAM